MLLPLTGLPVREYDVVFTITPTSRHGSDSDSVYLTSELFVVNNTSQDITFPFAVLSTDPGTGDKGTGSSEPKVTNGSRPVELDDDDALDLDAAVEAAAQRAQQAGISAAEVEQVRAWVRKALERAARTKRGRTRIKAGESRRIVSQQRLRLLPDAEGVFRLGLLAPTPLASLATGGRVSVVGLLPWQDEDVRPTVLSFTQGFEVEQQQIKRRQVISWHWRNDPEFELAYRYD